MIYVFTGNYQQFQNFMQQHQLREDFGVRCNINGCKRGQVRYLGSEGHTWERLEGNRNAIVLCWGTYYERRDAPEVEDRCRAMDIPFVVVPDLARQRAQREHPERFQHKRWNRMRGEW